MKPVEDTETWGHEVNPGRSPSIKRADPLTETILLIDDDLNLHSMLTRKLEPSGYRVLTAADGREGLRMAYENHPDLVILDVMMPEIDGFEVCTRLRDMTDVPILMLTAKSSEQDLVRGFEAGADDYLTKPYSLRELEVRIRALLRRYTSWGGKPSSSYNDGTLRIDLNQEQVYRKGEQVHLTPTEFRLLSTLALNPGRVIPHTKLLAEVWGDGYTDAMSSLSLYVRYLREKLESDPKNPRYIRNRWGVGYWFAPQERIET